MASQVNQMFREGLMSMFLKLFQILIEETTFLNSFYEASIILTSNPKTSL